MTSKEAERLVKAQQSEAETIARNIARRWETEPEVIAYEKAVGKIEHLRGFLSGTEKVFNAYFVTEDPKHQLIHGFFKRELNQLSKELEYGSVIMPKEMDEPFEVVRTPDAALHCYYQTYEDGTIYGVFYKGFKLEASENQPDNLVVPNSTVLGDLISIEAVAANR